jgi:hypothetical protein
MVAGLSVTLRQLRDGRGEAVAGLGDLGRGQGVEGEEAELVPPPGELCALRTLGLVLLARQHVGGVAVEQVRNGVLAGFYLGQVATFVDGGLGGLGPLGGVGLAGEGGGLRRCAFDADLDAIGGAALGVGALLDGCHCCGSGCGSGSSGLWCG